MAYTNSPLVTYTLLSPHYNPREHEIDTISIHCVVGQLTAKQVCNLECFAVDDPDDDDASCNYVVGTDGSIGLCVEEKNRSWCTSSRSNDHRAITIEVASDTKHPYAVNSVAYAALLDLVTDICKRNGIKKLLWKADKSLIGQVDKQNMTVHRWFANKACPGDWLYERHGEIAAEVNKRLNASVEEKVETPVVEKAKYRVQVGAYSKMENAEAMLKKLKAAGFDGFITTIDGTEETSPVVDTAKVIWDFFIGKGLNAFAVAGIMGNLKAESALNPKNLQQTYEKKLGFTDDSYTTAVDNGSYDNFVNDSAGYGLAQWTYWSRKQALLEYARSVKKSIGDLSMQLDFMWKELQGYTSVMKVLKSATSVREASDAILTGYERPADQGESAQVKRADFGKAYYDWYVSGATAAPTVKEDKFTPYLVKITADDLNIRKGAGTDTAIVGNITDKGVYTIVEEANGKGADRWGKLKSGVGWISLDYTKKI